MLQAGEPISIALEETGRDLSGVGQIADSLWVAADEGHTLERLVWRDGGYHLAEHVRLPDIFATPPGDEELDLEALSVEGDRLWIAGSHSRTRPKPRRGLEEFAVVDARPHRCLIGCWRPGEPTGHAMRFTAAGNELVRLLEVDPHLGRFVAIPAKENGFDIEGIAACGTHQLLGLRGPTLRAHAVALAVDLRPRAKDGSLKLKRLPGGHRYAKLFLPLQGLGIRDLAVAGQDVLILAGPTGDLRRPFAIWRWRDAFTDIRDAFIAPERLEKLLDLDPREGKPEGLTRYRHVDGRTGWLVLHDGETEATFYPRAGE